MLLPQSDRFSGIVSLPGSKSITNRTLLLAALANGTTGISHLLESDDTRHMLEALHRLGVSRQKTRSGLKIGGLGGPFSAPRQPWGRAFKLFLGNAGTAMRPLCAALCLGVGDFELEGEERMYERPIGDLVDALRSLGAKISYLGQKGYPPLLIQADGLDGGFVKIRGNVSSQYLSALLMAAPYCKRPLTIEVEGELISRPYIHITLAQMKQFGVVVEQNGNLFSVPRQPYTAVEKLWIEGDASAASYFLAGAAIAGGAQNRATVEGVGQKSIQGDVWFTEALERMGAGIQYGENRISCYREEGRPLLGIDFNAGAIPDAAMTLCPLALFAEGRTRITGIGSWKVKETDRILAMATELRKLGAEVEFGLSWMEITPPKKLRSGVSIATYNDHRMAMSLSLASVGAKGVPVNIENEGCVSKTFPNYWEEFRKMTSIRP
jgi:3-phosphoshikimate 1-carboxyvinyltransferase